MKTIYLNFDKSTGCHDAGCFKDQITYDVEMEQIVALMSISTDCQQSIHHNCSEWFRKFFKFSNYLKIFDNLSKVNALTDYAWWNGRDGTPNYYWNGSKSPNSRGCACYETDSCEDIGHEHRSGLSKVQKTQSCSLPSQPYERGECNCDARLDVNIDEGVLTSMNQLPVTQLNYGDSQARYSWINYELGQLRCYGKSRPYPNEEEIIEMFDDIHDNIKDLQQWIDKYDPSTYLRFYAMGDNSEFSGGVFPTPLIYNRIDYNLGNNFMKETGVFHAPQGKPKVDYSLFKFFKLVFTSLFSI